jgi:flagellar biosynthesis/type III secretory pathway chaperone
MQTIPGTQPSPWTGESAMATIASLTDVIRSESRLLRELLAVMQRQRDAVAADDLQAVEESVYATHRVLHTLNEARRRRRAINRALGESDDLPIRDLDGVLGVRMSDELRRARDELELLARALSNEVDVNRRVLRQALAAGDEYVRTLYGAAEPRVSYRAGSQAQDADRPAGGLLVNRTA